MLTTKKGKDANPVLLFKNVLRVLARAIRQEKEIKVTQIEKEVKLPFSLGDMVLHVQTKKAP